MATMTRPEDLYFSSATPLGGDGGVRVTWLGTAGFVIEHDGHVLLLDPYLTRASLARCVFAPLRADAAVVRRLVPRADAIVLSHTHFDHALDVPAIAAQTGARVFGSRSALHLCRSSGLPDAQLECVEPGTGGGPHEAEVGPFRLRFWPSAHSAFLFGRVPLPGDIADCSDVPLRTEGYRCGAVFGAEIAVGGRRLFHVGSAELVERGWHVAPVDLVLACVAGWTSTERYPERLVAALSPGAVLLHHWDNFLRGIDGAARALPAMRFAALVDRLDAAAPRLPVGALPLLGTLHL
jgi:L-ascorbate metabolism protein UlaG (beta-lactamase superfamily)